MVCILLSGGNDSFNTLIPRTGQAHLDYLNTRSSMAISLGDILPINPIGMTAGSFGVHPNMPEVQQMFQDGKLAFVSNVGTLVEPTTKNQYFSGSHPLPLGLYSHSDQMQHWQTGRPQERSSIGWGGRIADLVNDMNSNESISMNISLTGTNLFQRGNETVEYSINENGGVGIAGYGDEWIVEQLRSQAIDNMLDQSYSDIYKKTYMNTVKSSHEASLEFQEAIEGVAPLQHEFAETSLSQQLRMIATTMAARETLGFQRQIFFVAYDGWDHHDELLNIHSEMSGTLSRALSDFDAAMTELGLQDSVTTFTISDFARTLTSNGNGTDHGWGGNAMVMGGAVNGQRIYGEYPSLALGNPLDVWDGVLIPTTSADEYMAELALWFGVSPSDVDMILPNLVNFYDTSSPDLPLGFLNI